MFVEFMYHLLSLDLNWIIQFILLNLHWLFAFAAVMYFFTDGKKVISGIIVVVFVLWAMMDGARLMGWVFITGMFLLIFYVVKFFILKVAEETPQLQKKLIWINELSGYVTWISFNLWYMGVI